MRRRWEGDDRGRGIGHGRRLLPGLDELRAALDEEEWVAEEPELHLLPHLERACERLPLELRSWRVEDATFVVELRWQGEPRAWRLVREAAYSLLGSVAESGSYVRERADGDEHVFECATGLLAGDTRFAPHGHVVQLRIAPPA